MRFTRYHWLPCIHSIAAVEFINVRFYLHICTKYSSIFGRHGIRHNNSLQTYRMQKPMFRIKRNFDKSRSYILDLGMHVGDDTCYYLARGFNVIALEANPQLCQSAQHRFKDEISKGRLVIINAALCPAVTSSVEFHICNVNLEWSSLEKWRIEQIGGNLETIKVPGITLNSVLSDYGQPHYIKCDIEGADGDFVDQLIQLPSNQKPQFVSVEGIAINWLLSLGEFGYDRVQLVSQARIRRAFDPPFKFTLDGREYTWTFGGHTSGRFGFDLNRDKWISVDEASQRWLVFNELKVADPDMTLDNWFDFHVTSSATLASIVD
jgi:FkbM family methyltransferase